MNSCMNEFGLNHCIGWHHSAEFWFKRYLEFSIRSYNGETEKELKVEEHC